MSIQTIFLLLLIGLFAGVLSGLVGVGGGLIIVPALVYALGYSQHQAQGTSLGLLLLPIGVLAVINYYKQGYVDIKAVAVMTLTFVIGGWLGSKIAISFSQETLRKIFAIVLFYTAFKMLGWDQSIFKWVKSIFNAI
jgi:uncharacterized membrane protein YfcA